jgi:hypothetical protein
MYVHNIYMFVSLFVVLFSVRRPSSDRPLAACHLFSCAVDVSPARSVLNTVITNIRAPVKNCMSLNCDWLRFSGSVQEEQSLSLRVLYLGNCFRDGWVPDGFQQPLLPQPVLLKRALIRVFTFKPQKFYYFPLSFPTKIILNFYLPRLSYMPCLSYST